MDFFLSICPIRLCHKLMTKRLSLHQPRTSSSTSLLLRPFCRRRALQRASLSSPHTRKPTMYHEPLVISRSSCSSTGHKSRKRCVQRCWPLAALSAVINGWIATRIQSARAWGNGLSAALDRLIDRRAAPLSVCLSGVCTSAHDHLTRTSSSLIN